MNDNFIMKPKVDFCFKELMADEFVRRGFIAAVLDVSPETIMSTELLSTHLRKEHKNDKLGILDIRILLQDRTQLDIEIQVESFELWPERSLFYLAKVYTDQMHEGDDYDKLKKCIHIGILDFELFSEDEQYYSRFHIWEDERRRKYTDKFELHIFELPKLKKYEYPETELLNWMRFMSAEKKEEFEMLAEKDEYIEKAYDRLTKISADEQKRLEYEAREKAIRDHNWMMKTSLRNGFKKGYDSGYDLGYGSGYDSGYDSGYTEGERIGAIKAFIEAGQKFAIPKETVAKQLSDEYTLTDDEVQNYMKEYWK